jgi:hypothetical protein
MLADSPFFHLPARTVFAETAEAEQNHSEISRSFFHIEVANNLLSVELIDAEFGNVMNSIAKETGFKVEIDNDVSRKQLTTKFSGIDLERGIVRLLTLMREKNYLIHYDTKGMLNKIEIYGEKDTAPAVSIPLKRVKSRVQRSAPIPIPLSRPVIRGETLPLRPFTPRSRSSRRQIQPISKSKTQQNIIEEETKEEEIPSIPFQEGPFYIPSK